MNEALSKSASLPSHPQTTPEEYEYLKPWVKEERAKNKPKRRWKKIAKWTIAGLAYIPATALTDNADYLFGTRDTLAPVIDDCAAPEPDWEPSDTLEKELEVIEQNITSVSSSASKFRPTSRPNNSAERGNDILLVPWNFTHIVDEFVMPSSGITIKVRTNESDSGIQVNREALERTFNEPMERWYVYSDKSVRDFYYCARVELLDNKKQAGTTVNVILPSKPNYCLNGGYTVNFADNSERDETCKTSGFNYPNLSYGLLDPILHPDTPHYIFVTGRNTSNSDGNEKVTSVFGHESGHEIMRLMDARPLLDPDEQAAEFVERQLATAREEPLEPVFVYPNR